VGVVDLVVLGRQKRCKLFSGKSAPQTKSWLRLWKYYTLMLGK